MMMILVKKNMYNTYINRPVRGRICTPKKIRPEQTDF